MLKIEEKFEAAISDTDILIDLFTSGTLQILSLLFHKIYIPEFIYEKELNRSHLVTRLSKSYLKLGITFVKMSI